MANNTDIEPTAQELAQDHPPSWSQVFDDLGDMAAYAPVDQPPINKSAKQHAQRRQAKDQEQRHEQNLHQLQAQARAQKDEAAHEQVMQKISRGEDIPPALAEAAMRHQRQQGGLGLSTAERLSAATLARLRREAPPDDGTRRRRS
jgi:hypothetical protein